MHQKQCINTLILCKFWRFGYYRWDRVRAESEGGVEFNNSRNYKQVFNVLVKEIRITKQHITIRNAGMDILKEGFKHDSLHGWTLYSPQQWIKNDGYNCSVFVCTDFPLKMGIMGEGVSENRCIAQDIKVCIFQKLGKNHASTCEARAMDPVRHLQQMAAH
ncbi:hypothetical protein AOLI_G00098130 [Acnodon oligacanthus]